jgi:hypothetical protein
VQTAAAGLDALYKKSNWLEGIQVKNHLDDGAKRAFVLSLFPNKA